jgi:methylated-DNA-protein-cysteine methyltransferase-like protein
MKTKTIPFFEQVYAIVRLVPRGQVTSYGRIAAILDSPRAARAVGYAMRALGSKKKSDQSYQDVPWQRVINHVGYISIGGLGALRQAELLEEEGVEVSEELTVDLEQYLWEGLLPHEVDAVLKRSM